MTRPNSLYSACFLGRFKGNHILMTQDDKKGGVRYHHSLGDIPAIIQRNVTGCGVFFTINELDQKLDPFKIDPESGVKKKRHRTKKMLKYIRALYADDDVPRDMPRDDFALPPSVIVQSSQKKYHYYWILTDPLPCSHSDPNAAIYESMLSGIATRYGTDGSASQTNRVLRVPGYYHHKNDPFPTIIVGYNDRTYTWEELKSAFPPEGTLLSQWTGGTEGYRNKEAGKTRALSFIQSIWDKGGEEAHPAYRDAALSLANTGTPKDVALAFITGETLAAFAQNGREIESWRRENISTAVDTAYAKVEEEIREKEGERISLSEMHIVTDISEEVVDDSFPNFPEESLLAWPDPWPLLFNGIKNCSYEYIPALGMIPNMHWYSMIFGNSLQTVRGRPTGAIIRCIARSGVGKDSSTSEPQRIVLKAMIDPLYGMSSGNLVANDVVKRMTPVKDNYTSDTNLRKTMNDYQKGLYLLNTEASDFERALHDPSANQHMGQIMGVGIEAWNGDTIGGKKTQRTEAEAIVDPCMTVVHMHQLSNLAGTITTASINKGYQAREEFYVDNVIRRFRASTDDNERDVTPDPALIDFLVYVSGMIDNLGEKKIRVRTVSGSAINRWENDVLIPLKNGGPLEDNNDHWVFIKRIPMLAEKKVAILVAFTYYWRLYNGWDVSDILIFENEKEIQLTAANYEQYVIEYCNYQVAIKDSLFKGYVSSTTFSDVFEALDEIWASCLKSKSDQHRPWTKKGCIPIPLFESKAKQKSKAGLALMKVNDFNQAIGAWISARGLIRKNVEAMAGKKKSRTCYVPRSTE